MCIKHKKVIKIKQNMEKRTKQRNKKGGGAKYQNLYEIIISYQGVNVDFKVVVFFISITFSRPLLQKNSWSTKKTLIWRLVELFVDKMPVLNISFDLYQI
jgi:hypothetical protein